MTSPGPSSLYLGHALNPPSTDLDTLQQTASNAAATATSAYTTAVQAVAALGIVPDPAYDRVTTTLARYIDNSAMLWVKDYGVIGDGVADDTVALQKALTAGATAQRIINGGEAVCRITAPLTMSGPGLVFDAASFGNAGDPGIFVDGTLSGGGTPALTISGQTCALNLCVYGSGQTANAIHFDNPQRSTCQQVRAYNFDGYGVKIDKSWDCTFESISVEQCGNASAYAFSLNGAGDTCNMTHVMRLQAESCVTQAIYTDPTSLNLCIDTIHSERLTSANPAYYGWVLGGQGSFNGGKFTSLGALADSKLWLRGAYTDYTAFRCESITIYLEGQGGTGLTLVSPDFGSSTTQEYPAQSGALVILGGTYGTWSGSTANRFAYQGSSAFLPLSGGTLTGTVTMNSAAGSAGASTWRKTSTYKGYALSAGDTGVVASGGGTVDLADGNTSAVVLVTSDAGEGAIFLLQGGAHLTQYLTLGAPAGTWSNTVGSALSANVYWNAGSSTYRLQNNGAANRTYFVAKIGQVPTA